MPQLLKAVSVLYEALLLLALRVDGRGGLLGLVAASRGEEGADERRAEGRNRELLFHLSASVHHHHLFPFAVFLSRGPQIEPWRSSDRYEAPDRARSRCVEDLRSGRTGATYDVRSDLAAGDVVHSNHDGGIGFEFGRGGADEDSMDGRSAAYGSLCSGKLFGGGRRNEYVSGSPATFRGRATLVNDRAWMM